MGAPRTHIFVSLILLNIVEYAKHSPMHKPARQ